MVREDALKSLSRKAPMLKTVYVFEDVFMPWPLQSRAHSGQREAVWVAALALSADGAQLVKLTLKDLPELSSAFPIWAAMLGTAQTEPFMHVISDGLDGHLTHSDCFLELLKCIFFHRGTSLKHTLPAVALALVEAADAAMPKQRALMVAKGQKLRGRLDALLSRGDAVLVLPSLPTPAPRHHENLLRFTDTCQVSVFNTLQLPATAVPLGRTRGRPSLPLGCQIVAGFGWDVASLSAAVKLQARGVARAVDVI